MLTLMTFLLVLPLIHLTISFLALNLYDKHVTDWEIQLLADLLFDYILYSPWFEWKAPHLLTHLLCIKHSPAVDHGFGLGVVPPTPIMLVKFLPRRYVSCVENSRPFVET